MDMGIAGTLETPEVFAPSTIGLKRSWPPVRFRHEENPRAGYARSSNRHEHRPHLGAPPNSLADGASSDETLARDLLHVSCHDTPPNRAGAGLFGQRRSNSRSAMVAGERGPSSQAVQYGPTPRMGAGRMTNKLAMRVCAWRMPYGMRVIPHEQIWRHSKTERIAARQDGLKAAKLLDGLDRPRGGGSSGCPPGQDRG